MQDFNCLAANWIWQMPREELRHSHGPLEPSRERFINQPTRELALLFRWMQKDATLVVNSLEIFSVKQKKGYYLISDYINDKIAWD